MKNCPNCQASVSDTAKFCVKCGFNIKKHEEEMAQAEVFCPECGTKFSGGDFCPECGFNVAEELKVTNNDFDDSWLSGLEQGHNDEGERELSCFEYEAHSDGTYTVTGLKDKLVLNINVPKGVVAIADNAFYSCEAINITLPEGLLKIGNAAFCGLKDLSSINIPSSLVYVGDEAFMDCIMLDIELPSTVLRVGKDALKNTAPDIRRIKAEEEERLEKERIVEEKRKKEEKRLAKWAVGTVHALGTYPQSANGVKAPINWIVLERQNDKALLITENAIDCMRYNTVYCGVAWEGCTLRSWAQSFYNNFSNSEKSLIISASNENPGGKPTSDKVFILSEAEFEKHKYKLCDWEFTEYAKSKKPQRKSYWLRTPGYRQNQAKFAGTNIYDRYNYDSVTLSLGVRPVMWIKICD